jgi:putative transposase
VRYAFIEAHRSEFSVRSMCHVLTVHFSGFYAWLKEPLSPRALEDARQTELIQQAWTDSGKVYGYRKLTDDLRPSRQIALQSPAGQWMLARPVLRTVLRGWPVSQASQHKSAINAVLVAMAVADNTLDRQFEVEAPDTVWVTDITYIRTHEGWSFLSVVIDLFSRRVVGWSPLGRVLCTRLPGIGCNPAWQLT